MRTEPTNQQRQLQDSCPHQPWIDIDLSQYEYFVRRSSINPRDTGFMSEVEPAETRAFRRPTPALRRSVQVANLYGEQGYNVIKDVQWGVHQLSKPGEPTFFLFIEFKERPSLRSVPVSNPRGDAEPGRAATTQEYVSASVRVEKRMLKVLKALAELDDQPLSDLLESMIAHALDGKDMFSPDVREHIEHLKRIYGVGDRASNRDDDVEF